MKRTTTQCFCDVCKREVDNLREVKYPVIFHTEQTEGKGCSPYISYNKIEFCDECFGKALRLHGWGAQGYNDYSFLDNPEETL